MIVSSQLFKSYLECPTKWWLRSHAEPTTDNVYPEWVYRQIETYYRDGLKRLLPTIQRATALFRRRFLQNPKTRPGA